MPNPKHMGSTLLLGLLAGCAAPPKLPPPAPNAEVQAVPKPPVAFQTGRYSYIPAQPTPEQQDPLVEIVTVHFPGEIKTVEEAAVYLLRRSGYRLADPAAHHPKAQEMLRLSLPRVHRQLGPMPLSEALLTLGGKAFRLMVDPVHRLVAFDLSPEFEPADSDERGQPPPAQASWDVETFPLEDTP